MYSSRPYIALNPSSESKFANAQAAGSERHISVLFIQSARTPIHPARYISSNKSIINFH